MSNGKNSKPPTWEANNNGPSHSRQRDYSRRPVDPIGWGEADNQQLRDCICAVTDAGAAIMLGRTSDGGALSITVLDGEQRIREWPHSAEELGKTLSWLTKMFAAD